ncbi:MAG: GerW family sporulation protein [Oscillospiraceae bacterium]|nr:GerW family sporulation protein [Oscillospiraceae bacterium]
MENSNIANMMNVTMNKIREIVDVDTVVGTPITTPDGVTLIPVSRVSYGFGTGGSDFRLQGDAAFAGGSGAGVKVDPVGFLIIRGESVRMISIPAPAFTAVDRIIDKAPEFIDAVEELIRKYTAKSGDGNNSAVPG